MVMETKKLSVIIRPQILFRYGMIVRFSKKTVFHSL